MFSYLFPHFAQFHFHIYVYNTYFYIYWKYMLRITLQNIIQMLLITTHKVFIETLNYSVFVDIFFIVYFWICCSSSGNKVKETVRSRVKEIVRNGSNNSRRDRFTRLSLKVIYSQMIKKKLPTNWMNFGFNDICMPHLIEKRWKYKQQNIKVCLFCRKEWITFKSLLLKLSLTMY